MYISNPIVVVYKYPNDSPSIDSEIPSKLLLIPSS